MASVETQIALTNTVECGKRLCTCVMPNAADKETPETSFKLLAIKEENYSWVVAVVRLLLQSAVVMLAIRYSVPELTSVRNQNQI
ncbi:Hypothetical predicted protein [Scomber scombrus]|uniref:Uncharacterized protein n=1 Tax=Scomber scombrus TaxID=13677 RepID=A0AAV1PHA8_SCOSC